MIEFIFHVYAEDCNHWILTSAKDNEVCIYDSLYKKGGIGRLLTLQIAKAYGGSLGTGKDRHKVLKVRQVPVQQQTGCVDCGLFAIAYAMEICQGRRAERANFKQKIMRNHLFKCISKQKMLSFPKIKLETVIRKPKMSKVISIELFCFCNMPESYDQKMVQCCKCYEWIHFACAGKDIQKKVKGTWKCSLCTGHGKRIIRKPEEFSYPVHRHNDSKAISL